jgi:hypothetical protein
MSNRFERMYGALLLLVVATLVMASILYGPRMWGVKVLMGGILSALGLFFLWGCRKERG